MLKYLTHKLKNHSLNEDQPHHKAEDDDHDSGTESDDEHGTSDEPEISMESEGVSSSAVTGLSLSRSESSLLTTPASPLLDSAFPSDCDQGYDQHSSEEELEVINRSPPSQPSVAAHPVTGQEKRKWSQVTPEHCAGEERSLPASGECLAEEGSGSGSRREERRDLRTQTPVQFRTSPPRGTHRPAQILSPRPQEASPRKRHRNTAPVRPCLDFEKMQQLKASGWRHGGDSASGDLSVPCW